MLPHTNKRRIRTNLKTKNNQNFQKIEQYGSPTTKEFKKKHSSRPAGGAEKGSWAETTLSKVAAGRPSEVAHCGAGWAKLQLADPTAPHSHIDKPGGMVGEQSITQPRAPGQGNKASNL